MEIGHEQVGAVSVLTPAGRLDTDSAGDLELALADLQAADARHFVLDLANIGYVSSAGLRVLLLTARALDGGKGSLRLCALNPQVQQVFDIAGFTKMFQIFADRAAALDRHPHLAEAAPEVGRLASRLMAAPPHQPDVDPREADVARRAASLLGAKPAPRPAPTPQAPAVPAAVGRTMALKSLKTPLTPSVAGEPAVVPPPKGWWARLMGMFRR